jgi:hypothetical protein
MNFSYEVMMLDRELRQPYIKLLSQIKENTSYFNMVLNRKDNSILFTKQARRTLKEARKAVESNPKSKSKLYESES